MTHLANIRSLAARSVRLGLGAILLYGGIVKALRPHEFLTAVSAYQLTTPQISIALAAVIPWIELTVGLLLIANAFQAGAALAAFLLMAVFSAAIAAALIRRQSIACGCFGLGSDAPLITPWTLARTLALSTLACWQYLSLILDRRPDSPSPTTPVALA